MKREILFRGKRENGQWVYGSLVVSENINPAIYYEVGNGLVKQLDWCYISPDTIGQYTGLKDKNGKKIFDGGILEYIGKRKDNMSKVYHRKVVFHEGAFFLSVEDGVHYPVRTPIYEHNIVNWDIVGNVHE